MPSNAFIKFSENASDLDQLIDLYDAMITLSDADGEPVPQGIDVLFRSAVVLMVSHWEAYVEDICSESLDHIISNISDASSLPKQIKKLVAAELKASKNELEIWTLADAGWRDYLKSRLIELKKNRDRSFNTPKSVQTAEFVSAVIGLEDVRGAWTFDQQTPAQISKQLDSLVEVRGQIAHRGQLTSKIDKPWVKSQMKFVRSLASVSGGRINSHVKKLTGKPLW